MSDGRSRRGRRGQEKAERRCLGGPRFVLEAIAAGTVDRVFIERALARRMTEVRAAAENAGIAVQEAARDELDRRAEGARHQGVLAEGPPYRFAALEDVARDRDATDLIVALDEITDPHNLGAIIRSAVAFGACGVLVPKHRAATITPVVVRASAGASEHAQICQVTNLQRSLEALAEQGWQIVGLAGEGTLSLSELPTPFAGRVLVIGSEGKGLRRMVRQRCDVLARIPQQGPIESLNASVAAGIAIYEHRRGVDG